MFLVVACTIAFANAVPVGAPEPRPVAPLEQLAPLAAKVGAEVLQSGPENEKDLAAESTYGYGYYYRPYHYGYYPHYYRPYVYRPYYYGYPYYRYYY